MTDHISLRKRSFNTSFKINKETAFFWAFTFCFIGNVLFGGFTNISDLIPTQIISILSNLCTVCYLACTVYMLFLTKYTNKELIIVVSLLSLFLVVWLVCKVSNLFMTLLLIVCSKNINFEKFCKFAMKLIAVIIIMLGFLSVTGIIKMSVRTRDFDEEITRYAMGFTHPNQLGILSFQWICCFLFINRKNKKIRKFILCILIMTVVYMITNSGTSFILSGILILLSIIIFVIEKYKLISERKMGVIIKISAVLGSIVLLSIVYYIWKNPYILSNSLRSLRVRFTLAQRYINAYGINLFGNEIALGSSMKLPGEIFARYSYLDNGYIRLLVEGGILASIAVLSAFIIYLNKLMKSRSWQLLAIVACLSVYYFTESKMSIIYFNVFLIDIGIKLYGLKPDKLKDYLYEMDVLK